MSYDQAFCAKLNISSSMVTMKMCVKQKLGGIRTQSFDCGFNASCQRRELVIDYQNAIATGRYPDVSTLTYQHRNIACHGDCLDGDIFKLILSERVLVGISPTLEKTILLLKFSCCLRIPVIS
jgi:hypothetical protein